MVDGPRGPYGPAKRWQGFRPIRSPEWGHPSYGNASATGEALLIFCYIGVGNTADAQTVWLDRTPKEGRDA